MSATLTDALSSATTANTAYLNAAAAYAYLEAHGAPEPDTTNAWNDWVAKRAALMLTKGDVDANYPSDNLLVRAYNMMRSVLGLEPYVPKPSPPTLPPPTP